MHYPMDFSAAISRDRQLDALLKAASDMADPDGQTISASRENIELLEELQARIALYLDDLRTARRRELRRIGD